MIASQAVVVVAVGERWVRVSVVVMGCACGGEVCVLDLLIYKARTFSNMLNTH
jgi:hypothetical protein